MIFLFSVILLRTILSFIVSETLPLLNPLDHRVGVRDLLLLLSLNPSFLSFFHISPLHMVDILLLHLPWIETQQLGLAPPTDPRLRTVRKMGFAFVDNALK